MRGGGLDETLHFGIFHPIAVIFLRVLRWIHGYVGNWGWAIVLLTIGIRLALFPLMHKSTGFNAADAKSAAQGQSDSGKIQKEQVGPASSAKK